MVEVIHFRYARRIRLDVSHVPGLLGLFTRVRSAVRLIGGIEMSAGRARILGVGHRPPANVKTVLAGGKAGDFAFHVYAIGHFYKRDRAWTCWCLAQGAIPQSLLRARAILSWFVQTRLGSISTSTPT